MKNHNAAYTPIIINLGIMNQLLLSRTIDLKLLNEARQLQKIDAQLLLFYKTISFNFIERVAQSNTLLVGEGNLSFALSLAQMDQVNPSRLTASTFEPLTNLSDSTKNNAEALKSLNTRVLHAVDATMLSAVFGLEQFDTIIFQFPNVASREPVEGHNPNFILVRDFLISAALHLSNQGQVLISAVHNPYYLGAFHFEEAAKIAGFLPPENVPFEPEDFPGYSHTMTHEEESALENHDEFSTWIFVLKS